MSTAQAVRQQTTASSFFEHDELHQGAHYQIRPNSSMAYQHSVQALGDGAQMQSISKTAYNSPQPSHVLLDDWQRPYIFRGENELGVWRQYVSQNGFEEPTLWPYRSNEYRQALPPQPQQHYPNLQLHGRPPMTLASDYSTKRQTPRATPDLEPHPIFPRAVPASKKKAAKKPKDKAKRAALEKPLSELTKELTYIPIKDTDAWVNRPFDERQTEKRKDGSIKRPSNSFMLYRSAYTERCRELEKSKNHQDISSIAGASWAIETPEIKNQFEEWAKVERENHQKAFPDYKFQPQTQAAKEKKRKRKTDDSSEEASDLEDPTYFNGRAGVNGTRRSTRDRNGGITYREYSDSPTLTSQDEANTPEPYMLSQDMSYVNEVNVGKPLPLAMDRLGQTGGYYVTSNPHPYGYPDNGEETQYYAEDAVVQQYGTLSPPMGLPGASHDDLIGELADDGGHLMLAGAQLVDPELEAHGPGTGLIMDPPPGSAHSGGFRASDYVSDVEGLQYLTHFDREDGL